VADSLDAVGGFGGADDQDSGDGRRREYSGCRHEFQSSLWKPSTPSLEISTLSL